MTLLHPHNLDTPFDIRRMLYISVGGPPLYAAQLRLVKLTIFSVDFFSAYVGSWELGGTPSEMAESKSIAGRMREKEWEGENITSCS